MLLCSGADLRKIGKDGEAIVDRETVQSSNLLSVGYDANSKTLEIEFRNGSIYQYFDVPEAIYLALMNATSQGKFFHQFVRERYSFKRTE